MATANSGQLSAAIASFRNSPHLLPLRPRVQHYLWGNRDFIPSLLGTANPEREPYAELWFGAHPELPSLVSIGGMELPLDELIHQVPEEVLGAEVCAEFSRELPYLLKVLCAESPLSIQSHPTQAQSRDGFERENTAEIALNAPHRSYRDRNHKPELLVALSDFYGLRGFRPLDQIARVLDEVEEFRAFGRGFESTPTALKSLYETFMRRPQSEVDAILGPLVKRLGATQNERLYERSEREYWVLRADAEFSRGDHKDRGLFSIFLLNLVYLRPGEAMYLPAGVLHAYLQGEGVEIMANSNNVLRGGLTSKHVDVDELLKSVTFEGAEAEVLHGEPCDDASSASVYRSPASEFQIERIEINGSVRYAGIADRSAEIFLVIEGGPGAAIRAVSPSSEVDVRLERGGAFLVPHGVVYSISAAENATLFKAAVPNNDA